MTVTYLIEYAYLMISASPPKQNAQMRSIHLLTSHLMPQVATSIIFFGAVQISADLMMVDKWQLSAINRQVVRAYGLENWRARRRSRGALLRQNYLIGSLPCNQWENSLRPARGVLFAGGVICSSFANSLLSERLPHLSKTCRGYSPSFLLLCCYGKCR